MADIKQLKKQLHKLRTKKEGAEKPYYLFYAAEYGKINNIGIRLTEKDNYKELQKDTEEFLKWQKYILSDDIIKVAVEENRVDFAVMDTKATVNFIGLNDLKN